MLTGPGKFDRVSRNVPSRHSDIKKRTRLFPVAPDLDFAYPPASAILRQSAAGAFSLPPVQVPSGPKILW